MEVINGSSNFHIAGRQTAIGLGNFDGLHAGHMVLINTLIEESRLNGYVPVVYTFTKHTENILRKGLFIPLLTTISKKISLLEETRLDYLCFDEFDETYSRIEPEDFVKDILLKRFNMKLAVTGFNYRFGYKGTGDVDLLNKLGLKYGFKVITIPPVKIDDEIVSSTLIRNYVRKGDMEKVTTLLGRQYSLSGIVQRGRNVGKKLGFPTANIYPENGLAVPDNGVYITKTSIDGEFCDSITNVGNNPTFSDNNKISVETHILDFDRDIYDKYIEVFFIKKIRPEKKFESVSGLIEQISTDIKKAQEYIQIK